MNIEVVLPVVNYNMANKLLHSIHHNTVTPCRVFVIDNTKEKGREWYKSDRFETDVLHSKSGLLNESWELARERLSGDCDFVSFLNDDIVIGSWFFERVLKSFETRSSYSIVIPNTVENEEQVKMGEEKYCFKGHGKLEAWAFTIKKDILDRIPPIPYDRIELFYGDNWIWEHAKRMTGCGYVKDLGNKIFHHVGTSIIRLGMRSYKVSDRLEWWKIKKEVFGITT